MQVNLRSGPSSSDNTPPAAVEATTTSGSHSRTGLPPTEEERSRIAAREREDLMRSIGRRGPALTPAQQQRRLRDAQAQRESLQSTESEQTALSLNTPKALATSRGEQHLKKLYLNGAEETNRLMALPITDLAAHLTDIILYSVMNGGDLKGATAGDHASQDLSDAFRANLENLFLLHPVAERVVEFGFREKLVKAVTEKLADPLLDGYGEKEELYTLAGETREFPSIFKNNSAVRGRLDPTTQSLLNALQHKNFKSYLSFTDWDISTMTFVATTHKNVLRRQEELLNNFELKFKLLTALSAAYRSGGLSVADKATLSSIEFFLQLADVAKTGLLDRWLTTEAQEEEVRNSGGASDNPDVNRIRQWIDNLRENHAVHVRPEENSAFWLGAFDDEEDLGSPSEFDTDEDVDDQLRQSHSAFWGSIGE
jgi:hypothetical protein